MLGLYKRGNLWWMSLPAAKSVKRKAVSLHTSNEAIARQIARLLKLKSSTRKAHPIHQILGQYLEYKERMIGRRFYEDLGFMLQAWIRETKIEKLEQINPALLQSWFDAKCRTVKVSSAASYLTWLGNFFSWCVQMHYLEENPASKVQVPRHSKPVRRVFVSAPEVRKLLNECEDLELKFCLYCGFHAGLRFGEVVQARPLWFDLNEKLLHVTRSSDWEPKDREDRTIPLSNEFCDFLRVYGLRVPFMVGGKANSTWRYRFSFRRRFKNYVSLKGYPWLTFHDCRRTFASLSVSRGISLYKVAKWLGAGFAVVERHYGHLEPRDPEIDRVFGQAS